MSIEYSVWKKMEAEERLGITKFLVEATGTEQLDLWCKFSNESPERYKGTKGVSWKQLNPGCVLTIGYLDKRPVVLTIYWDEIEGELVGFYSCNSQVVDWKMIEDWLSKHFKQTWDKGRPAKCDAINFHHCLRAIEEDSFD